MSSKELTGIPHILNKLEQFTNRNENNTLFFRGHSKDTYLLKPSVYRDDKTIENEHIIFKELLIKCPQDFIHCQSTFEFLVKMQHYSLPTRLLDITTNPLIALYFACKTNHNFDGELLTFSLPNERIKYYDSDTVSVISNISRRLASFKIPTINNETDKAEFNKSPEIQFLLHEIGAEKPYFRPLIEAEDLSSVVCVKPKLDNPRVIKQDSAFFLFGVNGEKKNCANFPDEYLLSKNEKSKIVIKASDKQQILNQLQALGVTEATVFPEIETVAKYIKKMYSTQKDTI